MSQRHYRALRSIFLTAPINRIYQPTISISAGEASVSMVIDQSFFHAAGAIHGAVYFKVLDDAAFFAANSLEQDVFLLTTAFNIYLTRPVSEGVLRAVGKVVNRNRSQFIAEAVAYDAQNREVARGSGIFVRGKTRLLEIEAYSDARSGS